MPAPHPIAVRIHDNVLGLIGTALVKSEMCETLSSLGRHEEVPERLRELRSVLEDAVTELRGIMADLRQS